MKKEEDFCEWKRVSSMGKKDMIAPPHDFIFKMKDYKIEKYPYCAHCGKKIKVVE